MVASGTCCRVNYDAVFEILTNDGIKKRDAEGRMEQAQRVAWRILKDWIESQIALMESGMVCMEEVFLPYMLAGDRTVYDALVSQEFRALSSIGSSAIAVAWADRQPLCWARFASGSFS